ncbi:MAG: HAMP domain-containing histidine kinase [Deltaproteobacteria bacterium]|nr:HAMP domain-containing histidine kinase [Deltaproteobacteria bacterium]
MKVSSLRSRIWLSGLVTSLVSVLLVRTAGSLAFHRVASEMDRANVDEHDVALCERAPDAWSKQLGGFLSVYAYDAATGLSANPHAPALDRDLVARTLEPGVPQVRRDHGAHRMLVRMADAGPCSLFQVRIQPPPEGSIHTHAVSLTLGGVAAMLAIAALSWLLAVRPIVRRIRRVRDAAGGVGREGYASAQDHAEDEISHISEVLDASHERIRADRDELVVRQKALERHLAEIAHDLRTPLASLLLATEELSESAGPGEGGEPGPAARALEDTVYLDALVDNLRQATLLRHGLDPLAADARADLGDVARRVGERFAALGRRRGVEVVWAAPDNPVPVRCPPALAERALANLVHNAVVHGRSGGHVAIVLESMGGRFTLQVLDDGPGVPPNVLPDLASRTFRDDPARSRDQGLGLAITNEVCRRTGWAIRYDEREGGGLKVEVEGGTT